MSIINLAYVLCAGIFLVSCSSLDVRRFDLNSQVQVDDGHNGVPFYLTRQDFILYEFGMDEAGKETAAKKLQVELVTSQDRDRVFVVRINPALFSRSEFTIVRDLMGRPLSISATSEDRTLETVQAIASTVVTSAAFAAAEEDHELQTLQGTEASLLRDLDRLNSDSALDRAQKVKAIQESLSLVHARMNELKAAKAQKPGSKKSGSRPAPVEVVASKEDAVKAIRQTRKDGIVVYLVPIQ